MGLNLKLLLVDDDEEFSNIFQWKMKDHLELFNWACNGKKALEMYLPDTYNVMVVDKNLPDLKGDQVLEQISNSHSLPPVTILLTGTLRPEEEEQALALGVNRYLEKDFNFQYIQAILEEAKDKCQ